MTRYLLLVHVRPEGSLDVFDAQSLTVNATDDAAALAVAGAVAEERGWECQRAQIIRREPINPMKGPTTMPTITYEAAPFTATSWRSKKPRTLYHYKVLIDGEWRATFENRQQWSRAGFDLKGRVDEKTWISLTHPKVNGFRTTHGINRDEFDTAVQWALKHNTIATTNEIERYQLITQAERDDKAWSDERNRYRHEVRNEMLREALTDYVEQRTAIYGEHPPQRLGDRIAAARTELERIR